MDRKSYQIDIFSIIGIFVGLRAVGHGLLMKDGSVPILFSPKAIMVTIVGTTTAVICYEFVENIAINF